MRRFLPEIILALLAVLTRLPFPSRYLYSWDAAQFALALERFDIAQHQPHPPGYILYVLLGKAFSLIVSDANGAFVALSIAASAVTAVVFYRLAAALVADRRLAFMLATVFLFLPAFWFYGEVASTYIFDALFATSFALCAADILRRKRPRTLLVFSVLLGCSGGFRESLIPLFAPLWLLALAHLVAEKKITPRQIGTNVLAGALSVLVWFVSLLALSGGWTAYWAVTHAQLSAAADATSVFRGAPPDTVIANAKNIVKMALAVANALPASLALIPILGLPLAAWSRRGLWLAAGAAVWFAPSAFVYVFIHLGNVGYLMTVAPLLVLLASAPVVCLYRRDGWRHIVATALFGAVVVAEVATFAWSAVPGPLAGKNFWYTYFTHQNIVEADGRLHGILFEIASREPSRAVVVTQKDFPKDTAEYFRQLAYYLQAYDVYEIFGGPKQYFHVRDHAPLKIIRSATVTLPATTERIYLVADALDSASVSGQPPVRLRDDLPLYEVDVKGEASWSYAGYTFLLR